MLEAAHEVFAERGYSGATMPAIAERAGVSVKTVEAAFGTKAKLLKELIDVCIAGDDEPVALADRPVVAEMEAETDPTRMIEMFAVFATAISKRLAVVSRVLADAAASSSELAALHRTTLDSRYFGAQAFVSSLAGKTSLRMDMETAVATVWLLNDAYPYEQLTSERGFTDEQFVAWLADTISRLLLR